MDEEPGNPDRLFEKPSDCERDDENGVKNESMKTRNSGECFAVI